MLILGDKGTFRLLEDNWPGFVNEDKQQPQKNY